MSQTTKSSRLGRTGQQGTGSAVVMSVLTGLALAGCRANLCGDEVPSWTAGLHASRVVPGPQRIESVRQASLAPPQEYPGDQPGSAAGILQVSGKEPADAKKPPEPELLPAPEKLPEPRSSERPPAAAGTLVFTLPDALAAGLSQNPDLVTLRGQVDVSAAIIGVARTPLWNPFVQAQYFPNGTPHIPGPPGTASGQSNFYVWAMQRFQLCHQRQFRTRSAEAGLTQVQWNVLQAELLNVAQTMRLYFAALYQKDLHGLAADNAELNQRLLDVVERRHKANLARPVDVTAARIAARQARRQEELAEATFQAAVLALRQQLGIAVSSPLAFSERLTDFRWLPVRAPMGDVAAEDLAAELVEGRPDVLAAQAGVQVAQANFKLAKANMIPDLQAGPIYDTADDGSRFLGLRLQMDIPIWNTGAPLARQRRAELNLQGLTHQQMKVKAALEAQMALNRYERARRLAEAGSEHGPAAAVTPRELKEIIDQFQAGQADILAVLNTQNSLLQERRVALDVLNELAQSAANVIQATSLPPENLVIVAHAATADIPQPRSCP